MDSMTRDPQQLVAKSYNNIHVTGQINIIPLFGFMVHRKIGADFAFYK